MSFLLSGKELPPSHYQKQKVLKRYAKQYGIRILIETGTYLGNMINSTKNIFSEIYSIELDTMFYRRAVNKFKKYPHIKIIQGDSGEILKEILKAIHNPVLYWLDAHYFGGTTAKGNENTPIMKELEQILIHNNPKDLIMIDDARHFNGNHGYPTLERLESLIKQRKDNYHMQVVKGIIIIKMDSQ